MGEQADTWPQRLEEWWSEWLKALALILSVVGLAAGAIFGWLSQPALVVIAIAVATSMGTLGTAVQAARVCSAPSWALALRLGASTLALAAIALAYWAVAPGNAQTSGVIPAPGEAVVLPASSSSQTLRLLALPRESGRHLGQRTTVRLTIAELGSTAGPEEKQAQGGTATPADVRGGPVGAGEKVPTIVLSTKQVFEWKAWPDMDSSDLPIPRLGERWEVALPVPPLSHGGELRWTNAEGDGHLAIRATLHSEPDWLRWCASVAAILAALLAFAEGRFVAPGTRTHAAAGLGAVAALWFTLGHGLPTISPLVSAAGSLGIAVIGGGLAGLAIRQIGRQSATWFQTRKTTALGISRSLSA